MNKSLLLILTFLLTSPLFPQSWIRVNQLGYQEKAIKNAVLLSKENLNISSFEIIDESNQKSVFTSKKFKRFDNYGTFTTSYRLDFSDFSKKGKYFIKVNDTKSPSFRIDNNVYDGTADYVLNYMRQQRCGYNPYLKDSCHTHDGFIIFHPTLDSTHIDATGGWHDASDYLQYVTTSANAVFQMMFAYQQNPEVFRDNYDKNGDPGKNGIPDIIDEVKWGMDWLIKMNPSKEMMFNQLADDRDHRGMRLPTLDTTSYNYKNLERPVYFLTGQPQGVYKNKNRATGKASTAGKYASAFALGSKILSKYYPEYAKNLEKKAVEAYEVGLEFPGVAQTAPCVSPYFYEEDNYVDDMELAAAQLSLVLNKKDKFKEGVEFGREELITPWMGKDTARHYQWYPFVNLGHYYLAAKNDKKYSKEFINYYKDGLEAIYQRGKTNPFLFGVPFIWCSNNLVAGAITQAHLYNKLTKDDTYKEMEASLRDWLFGCNPWGTSMIVGLPEDGIFPKDPHTAFTHNHGYPVNGGLVDGPVYSTIFGNLKGITLYNPDEFADVQPGIAVYHDDYGDYSTNEPTMDGTASLTYYLSAMEKEVKKKK